MWQGTTDDGCVALANLLGWKVLCFFQDSEPLNLHGLPYISRKPIVYKSLTSILASLPFPL